MRILVSKRVNAGIDFPSYLVSQSPEEALLMKGELSLVVIDGSQEGTETQYGYQRPQSENNGVQSKLSSFPNLVKRSRVVVYIAEPSMVDAHLKLIVNGAGGLYSSNVALLKNQKLLDGFLKSKGIDVENPRPLSTSTELVSSNSINSILESFSNAGDEPLSPQSRDLLVRTVKEYSKQVDIYSQAQQVAAKSALDYAEENGRIFQQITNVNSTLKKQIGELETLMESTSGTGVQGGRLSIFPKFSLNPSVVKSHIKIKKIGNGVFCLSFVLGLQAYLVRKKNIRAQVIVLVPEQDYYRSLYKNYAWITSTSNKDGAAYSSDVVFVSYPTKQVMTKLVENQGFYESLIFLDMMTQGIEHLIRSRKNVWYFSSSPGLMKELKLPIARSIFSLKNVEGAAYCFKSWAGYPDKIGDRERAYIEKIGQMYSTLYESSL